MTWNVNLFQNGEPDAWDEHNTGPAGRMIILTLSKFVNGTGPGYISDLMEDKTCGLRSGQHPMLLSNTRVRLLNYGQSAFSRAAPVLWNPLPCKFRTCSSIDAFRSQLKNFWLNNILTDHIYMA